MTAIASRGPRGRISHATLAAALVAAGAASDNAYAQDGSAASASIEPAQAPAANSIGAGEDIVVTASRVRASGFTAPTPLTVVGAEQIDATAPTQVSDILGLVLCAELLKAHGFEKSVTGAGNGAIPDQGNDGDTHPQALAGRSRAIVREGVERNIDVIR